MKDKIEENNQKPPYSNIFNMSSEFSSVHIPHLPSSMKNKEKGYFIIFKTRDFTDHFLDVIDPEGHSVAKLTKSDNGTYLGALYEVKDTSTSTAKTKNIWAIHLGS